MNKLGKWGPTHRWKIGWQLGWEVRGWRDGTERKKDLRTTVWWLLGEGGYKGIKNGKKNTINIKLKKKNPTTKKIYCFMKAFASYSFACPGFYILSTTIMKTQYWGKVYGYKSIKGTNTYWKMIFDLGFNDMT